MSSRLKQAAACGAIIGLTVFSLDQLVGGYLPFSLVYSLVCAAVAVPVTYAWLGRAGAERPTTTNSKVATASLTGLLVALFVFAIAVGLGAAPLVALGYALIAGVLGTMVRYLLLGRRARRER